MNHVYDVYRTRSFKAISKGLISDNPKIPCLESFIGAVEMTKSYDMVIENWIAKILGLININIEKPRHEGWDLHGHIDDKYVELDVKAIVPSYKKNGRPYLQVHRSSTGSDRIVLFIDTISDSAYIGIIDAGDNRHPTRMLSTITNKADGFTLLKKYDFHYVPIEELSSVENMRSFFQDWGWGW